MTITVDLTPGGSVGVKASSVKDRRYLERIPYLVRRKGVRATWWTYLGDLRRDLRGRRVKWTKRVKKNLNALLVRSQESHKGNDDEILAAFAEDMPPYPFQAEGINFGVNVRRALIADDTGLGKTIQAMGIIFVTMLRGDVRRAIIVCQAGLKMQWYEEIHQFAREAPDTRIVHPGSKKRRKALYENPDWRILIINPELLMHDFEFLSKIEGVDLIAVDEASMIRNPETKTATLLKELSAGVDYRIALTATPVENRLRDLFSIFEFVDRRIFIDEDYFNRRYINWRMRRIKVRNRKGESFQISKRVPKDYKNLGEVRNKIRSSYIRRRVREVGLQLPDLVVQWEVLKMPPRQRAIYEAIAEEVEEKLKGLRGAALIQPMQGLRQACNSTRLVTKGKGLKKPGQVKVARLKELIDTELAGEQVIVFTDYERFAVLMAKELRDFSVALYTGKMSKRERRQDMDAFKVGKRRVLIATKAAERGHNLQNAAVVINADLPYNPAALKQRLGRVRRLNSKHGTVRMLNLVCSDTIEETLVMKKIYSRRQTFETIFGDDELTQADPLASMIGEEIL